MSESDLEEIRALLIEQKALAIEQKALITDSNKILHEMRRWGRIAFWAKVVLWTIVLLLPILLYPFVSHFIQVVPGGLGNGSSTSSTSIFGFPSPSQIQKALHPGT